MVRRTLSRFGQPITITPRAKTVDHHGRTTWQSGTPVEKRGTFAPQHLAEDAVTVIPAKVYLRSHVAIDTGYLVDIAGQQWAVVSVTVWPLGVEAVIERWQG